MKRVKAYSCKFCDFSTSSAFDAVLHLKSAHYMSKLIVDLSAYFDVLEEGDVHEHNR